MKKEIYKSDGSDGYTEGTWGYVIMDGNLIYCDGGYPSRTSASEAMCEREQKLISESD